ncbi:MAG: 16S rRNA (uracil(1498)-N(3))-methyltransferase [Ferruginibacter sp.]|nr:16S rRNA (uracil(1498)-N(3))-methyltransferase [Ferruginibacter sp.]
MSLPLFYEKTLRQSSDLIQLNEDVSKHIIQVLRMKTGALLELTDGQGTVAMVEIIDDHRKKCIVKKQFSQFFYPRPYPVAIAISPVKNTGRFEWFLEKATEIGVSEIIPLMCTRTERQQFKYERFNHILISAMLQSGQSYLPMLREPMPFESIVTASDFSTKLIAHCNEDNTKVSIKSINANTLVMIGPEGDFTEEEISLSFSNGFTPVSLGTNRLRTETAGVVAATMLCLT